MSQEHTGRIVCVAECRDNEFPTLWKLRVPIGRYGFTIKISDANGESSATVSVSGNHPTVTCGRLAQIIMVQEGINPPTIDRF